MAAVTICSDFGAQENKICHYFHCFPSFCHEVMEPDAMIVVFWMLSFKPTFSLSSFTFIKRLFSSLFSAIAWYHLHIWGYWYFSWQSWFQLVCVSSSPEFRMMLSAQKLNKQGDSIQPWCTPFPIWNQFTVPCPVLTVASRPAHRFLRRQTRCLLFPSLQEFSTVCCDPHSQRI